MTKTSHIFQGDPSQVVAFLKTVPRGSQVAVESFRRKGFTETTHVVTVDPTAASATSLAWVVSVCP